jgi:hypothetical protein
MIEPNYVDMSSQINEIAEALSKAQAELTSAAKDNSGYGYNYSDLASGYYRRVCKCYYYLDT